MTESKSRRRKARLVSLGLQNFQSIAEYQEIRFGRLTFLYGPNSSGKSAFLDAMSVGRDLWSADPIDSPWGGGYDAVRTQILHRHWRATGQDRAKNLRLRFEIAVPRADVELTRKDLDDEIYEFLDSALLCCVDESGELHIHADVKFDTVSVSTLKLGLAGHDLIRLDRNLSVNLHHPIFAPSESQYAQYVFRDGISAAENDQGFKFDDGWLTGRFEVLLNGNRTVNREDTASRAEDDNSMMGWEEPPIEGLERNPAFQALASYYDTVQGALSRIICKALEVQHVSASRQVPTRRQLTYLLDLEGRRVDDPHSDQWLDEFGIIVDGEAAYAPLASACVVNFARSLAEDVSHRRAQTGGKFYGPDLNWRTKQHLNALSAVNDALRHHFFDDVEKAYQPPSYQVTANVKVVVNSPVFEELIADSSKRDSFGGTSALVRLQLEDQNGLKLDFDEVGSGIGYVLPVFVTIHTAAQAFVQQPELHLHPALQAALGDVFIESANRGGHVIVESHSEHVLLRVLRRVRQSSVGRLAGSDLEIAAEDVAVYFFEPTADRSTRIRRLRVSPEGDFLDRWPGGFFAERDRELFDE